MKSNNKNQLRFKMYSKTKKETEYLPTQERIIESKNKTYVMKREYRL